MCIWGPLIFLCLKLLTCFIPLTCQIQYQPKLAKHLYLIIVPIQARQTNMAPWQQVAKPRSWDGLVHFCRCFLQATWKMKSNLKSYPFLFGFLKGRKFCCTKTIVTNIFDGVLSMLPPFRLPSNQRRLAVAACYNNTGCEDTNFSIHWIAIPEFHNKRKWKLSQEHISCYACSHLLYGSSSLIWFPTTTFPTKWWSPTFITTTISKHHHHPNHKGCRKRTIAQEHLLTHVRHCGLCLNLRHRSEYHRIVRLISTPMRQSRLKPLQHQDLDPAVLLQTSDREFCLPHFWVILKMELNQAIKHNSSLCQNQAVLDLRNILSQPRRSKRTCVSTLPLVDESGTAPKKPCNPPVKQPET